MGLQPEDYYYDQVRLMVAAGVVKQK
ncbi:uncharacterized protein G2W53_005348 [Senna tora]|uniref:Uncharacterized protein n=1 Tax=Senna tora TaxID=362788 RepID=A0A834XEL4_9FABA|nr:uncharacterized protein G2W53_005348 [Senna tora]